MDYEDRRTLFLHLLQLESFPSSPFSLYIFPRVWCQDFLNFLVLMGCSRIQMPYAWHSTSHEHKIATHSILFALLLLHEEDISCCLEVIHL